MRTLLLSLTLPFFFFGTALEAKAAEGYVVKVDSAGIFLDLGSKAGATAGQPFAVFTKGEELKHPVTGASLGPIITEVGHGIVFEVQELYSVGRLEAGAGEVLPGQQYRLSAPPPPQPRPAEPPTAQPFQDGVRAPYYRSPVLDLEAVDIAAGDVDGDGAEEAVLADKSRVMAYPIRQDAPAWTPSCAYSDERTGTNIVSVETADLDGDGRAEVFATVNNTFFQRVETLVLSCADGKFSRKDTLPGMVRSYSLPDGGRGLATQGLEPTPTFPLSNLYRLELREGRYLRSKDTLRFKRLGWAYGFGLARIDGDTVPVFYEPSGRLRIQLKKRAFSTPEKYGQTSNRLRWDEKTFHFHPGIFLENSAQGFTGLYTLRNVPKFFALASSFGLYDRAELLHLRWTGMGLEPAWKADFTGYASGLAELRGPDGRGKGPADRLMAVIVGAGGKSGVWFFQK